MARQDRIPIQAAEMEAVIRRVSTGDSIDQVSGVLGGQPFQQIADGNKQRVFWRFQVTDRQDADPHEIFLGEFIDGRLVFGSIIPHGAHA